jgi:putative hydrolase of the HAD superfamily
VVFVDDAEPNTQGARRLGIRTILHTDPETTRRELARLIRTTPAPPDLGGLR